MLDRVEAPAVQDSYALITAFASLVDTVKSIASLVDDFTSSGGGGGGGGEKKAKTPGQKPSLFLFLLIKKMYTI